MSRRVLVCKADGCEAMFSDDLMPDGRPGRDLLMAHRAATGHHAVELYTMAHPPTECESCGALLAAAQVRMWRLGSQVGFVCGRCAPKIEAPELKITTVDDALRAALWDLESIEEQL